VRLDLLGHAEPVIQQVSEPAAAARPRLDLELESPLVAVVFDDPELDLAASR